MPIVPLANPRLILPSTRVVATNQNRAFDAIPGEVPFARMLQAQNRVTRIEPVDTYEPTSPSNRDPQPAIAALLPKLGEILPVKPQPDTRVVQDVHQQVYLPATGRVLDLYL